MSRIDSSPAGKSDEDAEDVRLMRLVARGDTAAFEDLIERHQSLVRLDWIALGQCTEEPIISDIFDRLWLSGLNFIERSMQRLCVSLPIQVD